MARGVRLKQAVQRANGSAGRPAGKGAVPELVALVVPKALAGLARSCAFAPGLQVEVREYERFTQTLLKQVAKERMVLVVGADDYQSALKKDPKLAEVVEGQGQLIVMASGEELSKVTLPFHRCVDVIDRSPSRELLNFKVNRALAELAYDAQVETIKLDGVKRGSDLEALNEIGMALSTERDLSRLLEMIVSRSRQMTWADGGSLYLIEADPTIQEEQQDYFKNKKMRFQVAQNDSRQLPFRSFVVDINKSSIYGYVALTQEPIALEDVYHIPKSLPYGWGGREFDAATNYRTMSMLTVPMVNWRGETIGVIQLINRKTRPEIILDDPETCVEFIQPFTSHDLRMAMSIASQASIAIQNTQLVDSIRTLFDGFIDASVRAIESRDPTTAGHSQRVATLTVDLAEKVDQAKAPKFKSLRFSREQIQEIRYASLLHDFGKIGVREHVLVKAKKLYPHELRAVEDRFELIRTITALKHAVNKARLLEAQGNGSESKALIERQDEQLAKDLADLEELLGFINRCNEPTVLAQGGFEQLHDIAKRAFARMDGSQVPFLDEKELVSLSVPRTSRTPTSSCPRSPGRPICATCPKSPTPTTRSWTGRATPTGWTRNGFPSSPR